MFCSHPVSHKISSPVTLVSYLLKMKFHISALCGTVSTKCKFHFEFSDSNSVYFHLVSIVGFLRFLVFLCYFFVFIRVCV